MILNDKVVLHLNRQRPHIRYYKSFYRIERKILLQEMKNTSLEQLIEVFSGYLACFNGDARLFLKNSN